MMSRLYKCIFLIACAYVFIFVFPLCTHAKPPRPGPNFVWIAPHTTPDGNVIPGHWKYNGPRVRGKVWIPGHYMPDGSWSQGHWKTLAPPEPGKVWVPGHYGPGGRWIRGHWR